MAPISWKSSGCFDILNGRSVLDIVIRIKAREESRAQGIHQCVEKYCANERGILGRRALESKRHMPRGPSLLSRSCSR
jgi:hypothetical protein